MENWLKTLDKQHLKAQTVLGKRSDPPNAPKVEL